MDRPLPNMSNFPSPRPRLHRLWVFTAASLLALGTVFWISQPNAVPQQPAPSADKTASAKEYDKTIQPFLAQHCLECHGAEKTKGDFRIDKLPPHFADDASRQQWQTVLKRVKAGEMPPKSKPRPPADKMQVLTDWIHGNVQLAEAARKSEGLVVLRRLNRVEYENTLRDLLGINISVQGLLPQDSSANGFDNVGAALHVSSFLMERYLEAANQALDLAIANSPQPALVKKRFDLKDERQFKLTTEKVFRTTDDALVFFCSSPWQSVMLGQFYPPDGGKYRFRIVSSAIQSDNKPVTYSVHAGKMGMAGRVHLVSYFDAPPNRPAIAEFFEELEPRNTIRILPYGLPSAQAVHKIGANNYEGPGLAIQFIEVEGPLHDSWPPPSHRNIFGDLPQKSAPIYNQSKRVEVVSNDPEGDARKILLKFARNAFRRSVTDEDIKPYLNLVKARLAEKYSFEKAVRVGLSAILVSPEFLYLRERPGKLDDFALASRLSYFLWSSRPDEELLTLAEQGKLSQPKMLRDQVERMLKDKKAAAFTENFVGQWLNLREIDATSPSHILYPEYDEMLKHSMLRETYLFFEELLKDDLSLTNLVSSDFTMLNGRLAKHYGIPGVDGWEFRKVTLPKNSHRGGVLTMASVLKVTANGTYTSPVLRGAWVLDRILGTPPSPPPEGVSAVDPDIRGAVTIREQLAKHRSDMTCASCHAKIDPPGFALESFDVIGGWREHYRITGNGKPVTIDGKRMHYREGKPVDPADVLPTGEKFQNIDEYKKLLLRDPDQIARALTGKMITYATGGIPRASEEAEIESIVRKLRDNHYGLRTLVHEIVQSELFQNK
jgi:mono/diheme cytochrome c family protein